MDRAPRKTVGERDGRKPVPLEELARRQGVVHRSLEEMTIPGFFASDEEFEEFQAMLRENRS
jgi:hypothetical protein